MLETYHIQNKKNIPIFLQTTKLHLYKNWLVVSTHLKNIRQIGFIFPKDPGWK